MLLFLALLFSFLQTVQASDFFVLKNREGAGLFSMFGDVLSLVHRYELGTFQGIEVDFGNEGLYYDANHGPNWWNYYCEPICLGKNGNIRENVYGSHPYLGEIFFYKSREEAFLLIEKYIHFLPYLIKQVEQFQESCFKNHFMIGIHYRGTDAPGSSPSYEAVFQEICKVIPSISDADYKFFIATDEQPFIDFMKEAFPGRICYQKGAYRSSRGGIALHMNPLNDHRKQGEEAIIDCMLLSKCRLLMLSYSNLSVWAALLNPKSQIIDLSNRLPMQIKTEVKN